MPTFDPNGGDATQIFVIAHNRPIYLWVCLDALYRYTKCACRVTLIDVASTHPDVAAVIDGFVRRGFVHEVVRTAENNPFVMIEAIRQRLSDVSPWFAYVEGDAVVSESEPCWLERMTAIMQSRPRLGMLGSAIDRRDFVDPARVAHLKDNRNDAAWSKLLKSNSSERRQRPEEAEDEVFEPHTPAGRLLLLRREAVQTSEIQHDSQLAKAMRAGGWETGIAAKVFHRHLSLLHVYDLPQYDVTSRDEFMSF